MLVRNSYLKTPSPSDPERRGFKSRVGGRAGLGGLRSRFTKAPRTLLNAQGDNCCGSLQAQLVGQCVCRRGEEGFGVMSGFNFGGTGTSAVVAKKISPKLNLGNTVSTQPTVITGTLGLGTSNLNNAVTSSTPSHQVTASTPFAFGSVTTSATQSSTTTGFLFIGGSVSQTGSTSFNIASMGNAAQPTFSGLPLTPATQASIRTVATQLVTLFSFGEQSIGLTLASTAPTTIISSTMLFTSISNVSTSTAAIGFSSTTSTTTTTTITTTTTTTSTTTSDFALNLKPLTSTGINNTVPVSVNYLPSTSTANWITTPVMTYDKLEGLINKRSLELEDQEKHFLHQATQVNACDRTLIENGEQVRNLHGEVEKVKLDQKRLEQELDFILSQQKKLIDPSIPLEESVKGQSGSIYLQHANKERERTYKLSENINVQLKRMAQDLKDIIEHLNTFGSPADTMDLLQQICKILNAHMDSLQWIDQHSGLLQRKVEEVTQVFEDRCCKEQECNIRIAFD
nr:nucleoporin-62 C-terminal-like protein [Dasypus novemcinctus]